MIGNGGRSIFLTPEGGLAYWVINDTGAPSVKGTLCEVSAAVDNAVDILGIDDPDPMAIVYDDGVANGGLIRIVFSGRAEVLFVGSTNAHDFARNVVAADVGAAAGSAIAEAVPVPPFSTDKHFMEIGHVMETRVGAGLALVNLHFN